MCCEWVIELESTRTKERACLVVYASESVNKQFEFQTCFKGGKI